MGFVELILTVCTLTQPVSCEERHLSFVDEGSFRHPYFSCNRWLSHCRTAVMLKEPLE